nr:aminotransferase class I/II-fold pyridoxal phosphate-dependent enzyme [Synergistales bacterium]
MRLSSRAQRLLPSATLTVVSKAKALKREGKPVISFGAGEPDFNSPDPALKYALEAMQQGKTHYTPGTGIPELKEAVSRYYSERFSLEYNPEQVLIGAGAKPLLYEALGCLVEPGDEVVLFTPAWVSYLEQIRLFGGEALSVDTSDTRYIPDLSKFRSMITPRTKCMILNTPNNPTGAVYDMETLKGLAEIAIEKDMTIIFDEIYERLVYGQARHYQILETCPEARERTLIINGV